MIKVVLSNNVRIERPPADVAERLIRRYTVANPDYYKLQRLGKWTGNTPEFLALWQRDGNTLVLPYGALTDVLEELGRDVCVFHCDTSRGDSVCEYESKVNLYPYQENAVKAAVEAQKGVLVAPCGSGKTQMGLEIASRLGVKTLWLTHTHDLLNQSMDRARSIFDLPARAYGVITAGKVEIGEVFTFATVQTMAKLDLAQHRDTWGCVIVDEAHHVAGTPTRVMQFSKVVGSLNAAYKFGLTATPKRADGLIRCMYAYLGDRCYEIHKSEVSSTTCPVEYIQLNTSFDCGWEEVTNPDGTLNYVALINAVCSDNLRNEQIAWALRDILAMGRARVLVLSDRTAQLDIIQDKLEKTGISATIVTGATKRDVRDQAIASLRNGQARLLLSTYQLAKEGLDIPELTHLVMASPNKTETVITQSVGRVARAAPGKNKGIVVDFADPMFPLDAWAGKRKRIYKKLGYSSR